MFTAVGLPTFKSKGNTLLKDVLVLEYGLGQGPNHSHGHRKGGAFRGTPQKIKNNREVPRPTSIL